MSDDSDRAPAASDAAPPGERQGASPKSSESATALFVARRFVRARREGFLSLISLVSALGFAVGVASLIVVLALMTGFQEEFIARIIGANAHLTVFPSAGGELLEDPGELSSRLEALEVVSASEPVIQDYGGLVGPNGRFALTAVTGVDPSRVGRVMSIGEDMIVGEMEDLARSGETERPGLILGDTLARQLGVLPGDTVRLIVPRPRLAPWGASVSQPVFEVRGFFATGHHEYDSSWSFVTLDDARRVFGTGQGVHRLAVRLEDFKLRDLERLQRGRDIVLDALGPGYVAASIVEQNRAYFSALKLEKLLMSLAIGLIVVVAALGVVSTLVLTVTRKIREIGVLSALGVSRGGILRIFVFQGLAMGVLGTIAGAAGGTLLALWLDGARLIKLDPEVYLLDYLPFSVRAGDVALVVAASLVVALLATVYPAWRAASLDPVEALRGE